MNGIAAATSCEEPAKEPADAGWQDRLKGTNISAKTLLATDYLNHYNEAVMIIEMLPQMPEMFEEIADWQPKSYVAHFDSSSLAHRHVAIAAYHHAPPQYRVPFERMIRRLDQTMLQALKAVAASLEGAAAEELAETCQNFSGAIKNLIDAVAAIVNGSGETASADRIEGIISQA